MDGTVLGRIYPVALAAALLVPGLGRADALGFSDDGKPVGAVQLASPLSIRQSGMGEVSVGGADVLRSWCNPALLSGQSSQWEVSAGGGSLFGGQNSIVLGAGWTPSPEITVGAIGFSSGAQTRELDSAGAETGKSFSSGLMAASLGMAWNPGLLSLGLAGKFVDESVPGFNGTAGLFDAGLAVRKWDCLLGVSLRNIGSGPVFKDSVVDAKTKAPTEARVGLSYSLNSLGLSVGGEYAKAAGLGASAGFGLEWWVVKALGLRAGLVQASRADGSWEGASMQYSFGLSGIYRDVTVDYALNTNDYGLANRVGLSWVFGARPVAIPEPERKAGAREPSPVSAPAKQQAEALNLAVTELQSQNVSAGDSAVIADLIRSELVKTGVFNVVEKANMDKILTEQAFQKTGCTSEECAVKLGKLLNVQRMVVGSFGKLMDKYFINVRVVNVETGKVIFAESANGRQVEDIESGVKVLAAKMAKQSR